MIPDPDLRALLERIFGGSVVRLERRLSEYSSSYRLEELDLRLGDGTELKLLLKHLGPDGLMPGARGVRPGFLIDPLREIEVYRRALVRAGLGTPRFFGADPDRGWLLIERIHGVELFQVEARQTWEAVAVWLARLHARVEPAAVPRAVLHDRAYLESWPERAMALADADAAAVLAPIRDGYARIVELLLASPRTVLHGEFYASNVLVDAPVDPRRVAVVDWEQTGIGSPLVDVAALTSGSWSDDDRAAIVDAYRQAARDGADCETLEACRLHLALQWLGWSDRWTAPPQHRHDWLSEAARSARRLGL